MTLPIPAGPAAATAGLGHEARWHIDWSSRFGGRPDGLPARGAHREPGPGRESAEPEVPGPEHVAPWDYRVGLARLVDRASATSKLIRWSP